MRLALLAPCASVAACSTSAVSVNAVDACEDQKAQLQAYELTSQSVSASTEKIDESDALMLARAILPNFAEKSAAGKSECLQYTQRIVAVADAAINKRKAEIVWALCETFIRQPGRTKDTDLMRAQLERAEVAEAALISITGKPLNSACSPTRPDESTPKGN